MSRYEGGWDSKFTQFIRDTGRNKDVDILRGSVTATPPNTRIRIDGVKFDLEADDVIIPEHVSTLKVGDRVIVASSDNFQRFYIIGKIAQA
jgi:hypothetical protein